MIKALALDYGNVISEPQDSRCYARMAAISGMTEDFFREAFWRHRPDYDRGSIRGLEMYRRILESGGLALERGWDRSEVDRLASLLLDEDLRSWSRVSRAVTEWALSVRSTGVALGILSNMPFDFLERYGGSIELFAKADAVVFSCDVGMVKPEPAIYGELARRLSLDPGEIAFFDDLEANVESARAAGIRAFLWTGLDRARNDFARVAT